MEKPTQNRLQFVHCDQLFNTREDAYAYVLDGQIFARPALYAEPMILKYGNSESPNVILALGASGDGVTPSLQNNKTFFIDFAEHSEKIEKFSDDLQEVSATTEELKALTSKIIESCGLNEDASYAKSSYTVIKDANSIAESIDLLAKYVESHHFDVKETDTIKLTLKCDEDEQDILEGDVKFKNSIINSLKKEYDNQIAVYEDGIFYNVALEYAGNGEPLYLLINGETAYTANIPTEVHAVSGEYNTSNESIVIKMSDDTEFSIDVKKLIAEWIVLGEDSKTPIVLTKDEVIGDNFKSLRVENWQEVLNADVRLHEGDNNILVKSDAGTTLYVKGTADNIKTTNSNVQAELDVINGGCGVEGSIKNAVLAEETRAKGEEKKIADDLADFKNTTDTKFHYVDDSFEKVKIAFQVFSAKTEHDLADEIKRSTETDERLEKTIESGLTTLAANLEKERVERVEADTTLQNNIISTNEKLGQEILDRQSEDNSLSLRLGNINLSYDEGINVLKFVNDQGVEKTIQLNAGSIVDNIYYDSATEDIVILYHNAQGSQQTVRVPVRALIHEIRAGKKPGSAVNLYVETGLTSAPDMIYGDVLIANTSDNILENNGGALRVSNSAITHNTIAIAAEKDRALAAEEKILADSKKYTEDSVNAEKARAEKAEHDLEDKINNAKSEVTTLIENEKNRAIAAETKIENDYKAKDEALANDLANEINRATNAELNLNNAISEEKSRAIAAEYQTLVDAKEYTDTQVLAEKVRAEKAEHDLEDMINAETNRAMTAEIKIVNDSKAYTDEQVLAEKDRAVSVENELNSKINNTKNEVVSLIEQEKNRAMSAETALDAKIDSTKNEVVSLIDIEVNRATTTETELRNLINSTKNLLEQSIEQEKDRAIAAESGLGITIHNEEVRAMSAETELRTVLQRLDGSPETIGSVLYLINQAIAKVVDDAPESFNTLKEIAIWLQTHATDAVAMQNQISENTSKILKEIADRIEEINKLKLLIEQEKDRAVAAENTLSITIHNEEDRAIRVETELRHLIENVDAAVERETERATGEEALLRELINNTKTEVTNLVSQETIRATSAETVLNTKIENLKQDITNITNKIDDLADDFVHRTGDTMTGSLYVNGIISASSAIYSSDIKLKENIESINDADIENVKKIDLKSYAFKADPTHVQKYGVIAQDLEVAGLKHLVYQGEEYKSVDYTAFLILKIAQLEKEIENLKNK